METVVVEVFGELLEARIKREVIKSNVTSVSLPSVNLAVRAAQAFVLPHFETSGLVNSLVFGYLFNSFVKTCRSTFP